MFGKKDGTSLKGKQHGIVNKLWKELKKRERAGELIAVPIDEYLSSQICHSCALRELEKVKTQDNITHHGVLVCKNCQTLWQRDVVASKNLFWIAAQIILESERPLPFRRQSTTNTFAATNAVSLNPRD